MALSLLTPPALAQETTIPECLTRTLKGHENASIKYQEGQIVQVIPVEAFWTRFDLAFVHYSKELYTLSLARADDQLMALVWNERSVLLLRPTYMCLCLRSDVAVNFTFYQERAETRVRIFWAGYEEVIPLPEVRILDFARVRNFGDADMRVNICTPGNSSAMPPAVTPKKHEGKQCPKCERSIALESRSESALIGCLATSLVVVLGLLSYVVYLKRHFGKKPERQLGGEQATSLDHLSSHSIRSLTPTPLKASLRLPKTAHIKSRRQSPMYEDVLRYENSFQSHLAAQDTNDSDGYLPAIEPSMQTFSPGSCGKGGRSGDKNSDSDMGSEESVYEPMP